MADAETTEHECPECLRKFKTLHAMNIHRARAHGKNGKRKRRTSKKGTYTCAACEQEFSSKQAYANHVRYLHPKAGRADDGSTQAQAAPDYKEHIAYLFGRLESEIEHYCRRQRVPFSIIASGVAGLFLHQEGG